MMLIDSRELQTRIDNLKLVLRCKTADVDKETRTILMGKIIGLELAETLIVEVETLTKGVRTRQLAGKMKGE